MITAELERKTQIVNFDRSLRDLIKNSPDTAVKRDLNRALHFYRQRYCLTFDEKKKVVLKLIESGAATFKEMQTETHYRTETLHKILLILFREKLIRVEKIHPPSGGGRPKYSYFLI